MNERTELLLGDKILNYIQNKTILIVGLGGVGGYVLETLARVGIKNFVLIDKDKIDITNINRQIIATHENVGLSKVKEWDKRINLINKNVKTNLYETFLTRDNIDILNNHKIDFIIDACDTVNTKIELIKYAVKHNISVISSMGVGKKLDASLLKVEDLTKTSYDKIAKVLRKELKDKKYKNKIPVLYSTEKAKDIDSKSIASISYMPAAGGILITNYVINTLIDKA